MGQEIRIFRPSSLNQDADLKSIGPEQSPFLKDYATEVGFNGELSTHTGNGTGQGSNGKIGKPLIGNLELSGYQLPRGLNKCVGSAEFIEVGQTFEIYYNSEGNHGIYVLDGANMQWTKVIIDPLLNLSLEPSLAIPEHNMALRVVYKLGEDNTILGITEMHLLYVHANNWQRWIDVRAALLTDGFDEITFPYFKTRVPHFDRREYIEWPTRPPMYPAIIRPVPFSSSDRGKINKFLNQSVQITYGFIYTDRRETTFSQWSLPYSLSPSSCNANNANLPRCLDVELYAGSPMVEAIVFLVKFCGGDWLLYDTIKRFSDCGPNDPNEIGNRYWDRTNQWPNLNYNAVKNTITYRFCGDREYQLFSQENANRIWSDMPLRSISTTTAGDTMLLANNMYYYPNSSCKTTDGINLSTYVDPVTSGCNVENVNITLYSYIGSDNNFRCQFAYKRGKDSTKGYIGGYYETFSRSGTSVSSRLEISQDKVDYFGMSLGDKEGLIMYLNDGHYAVIGRQYSVTLGGVKEYVGLIDADNPEQMTFVRNHFAAGGIFIMQYEFKGIPKAHYYARLASHKAAIDSDFISTSTWVMGIADSRLRSFNLIDFFRAKVSYNKEIELDATTGNIDLWQTGADLFYIFTPYEYDNGEFIPNRRWRFNDGYVYEDTNKEIGVPLLRYNSTNGATELQRGGYFTDHNGFFFEFTARGNARQSQVEFYGTLNCVTNGGILFSTKAQNDTGGSLGSGFALIGVPGLGAAIVIGSVIGGSSSENIYATYNLSVKDNNNGQVGKANRILVRGTIKDCETGTGIAGVAIAISRGGITFTSSDGTFELVVHPSFEGVRRDRIYISAGGECFFYTCDCKPPELIDFDETQSPCMLDNNDRVYPLTIERSFRLVVSRGSGLKSSGRNGIAIVEWDLAGRGTYPTLVNYLDIPSFLETRDYRPRRGQWSAPGGLNLQKDTAWVSFFRTGNLNFSSYLQWVGDKISFLNTKGEETDSTSGLIRVKISIQSLLDYNLDNRFGVTTKYQVQPGDIVRIYDNGEGVLFDPTNTNGFLDFEILGSNYNDSVQTQINVLANGSNITFNPEQQADGKTIIIAYDKRLEALRDKCGFWLEIRSPKGTTDKEQWCEIAGMYPVKNGEIIGGIKSGVFDTWDTYLQNRYIKIKDCIGKTFNHPFESSSVTDTWGEGCGSCGRTNFADPNALQRWYPDDVIKSDEFINGGRLNGLGTFRERNRKNFKGQRRGGIIAMSVETNIIAFIFENDWALASYDYNYVRQAPDGRIIAEVLDSNLSDPSQKVGNNFGCRLEDTSTIVFHNGVGWWVDVKNRGVIAMNFQTAVRISDTENIGYFDAKITEVLRYNSLLEADRINKMFEIIAGVDPARNEYLVTFRKRNIRKKGEQSFVSLNRSQNLKGSETIIYSLLEKRWLRFSASIPEYYGKLRTARDGKLMIGYKNGIAFAHNSVLATSFNEFFGVQVPAVVVVVANQPEEIQKIFQTVAIESGNGRFYVDEAYTEEPNSFTYIPIKYFTLAEHTQYAELLRDMNSYPSTTDIANGKTMLIDGKRIFGSWLFARFVITPQSLGKYFEVNNFLIRSIHSERSGK